MLPERYLRDRMNSPLRKCGAKKVRAPSPVYGSLVRPYDVRPKCVSNLVSVVCFIVRPDSTDVQDKMLNPNSMIHSRLRRGCPPLTKMVLYISPSTVTTAPRVLQRLSLCILICSVAFGIILSSKIMAASTLAIV